MRVFVDTSAFIALLDGDDGRHAHAARTFRWLLETAHLVTHNYVVVEAEAVARRRLGADAAAALTDAILPVIEVLWVDEALHREGQAAQRAGVGEASLVDHVSFAFMRRLGVETAFAYDADFDAQGFFAPIVPESSARPRRLSEDAAVYGARAPSVGDLVSVAEIAARAGRSVNTVQSWRRRHPDFPPPVARLAAGPVWTWPEVSTWIATRRTPPSSDGRPGVML
jgi:predicted nucleic acid-binding protein